MQELRESLISETIAPHNSLKDHFEFVCRECKKKTYNFSRKDRKQIEKWANSIEK